MTVLQCEGLCKSFDGVAALDKVSVELRQKTCVAIVGPNGAGKTTLLNVLSGFSRADSGSCRFKEQELNGRSPDEISRMGLVRTFQEVRIVRQVSVLENVLLAFSGQRGESIFEALFRFGVRGQEARNRQEALRILESVNLAHLESKIAGELSYGQQKLLSLAACLAVRPQVLLLDEPVSGVDDVARARILGLLPRLLDEPSVEVVAFIEHDLSAVQEVASEVIVMDHGRIIAQGKPTEVLECPEVIEAYLA
jgi:neutral amino acid transport system ATP-binding protein